MITVGVREDAFERQVTVSDSGPGVTTGAVESTYERGFGTKLATMVGGRGIGVSLICRICDQ